MLSTMFMLAKYASQTGVSLPEIMFWRQFVTLPMIAGWLLLTGNLHRLKTRRLGTHAIRAGVGLTGMVTTFGAAILLPLAQATTLGFTTPIFAVLLSVLVFREKVGPWRWAAVILGFIGVLIVTQPGHLPASALGTAAGLAAGLMVAIISFQIRDLARTEDPASVVFYFALFGTVMVGLTLPFFATAHTGFQWLTLLAIGIVGTLAQLLLTAALRYGSVATIIVMDYTALIWSTLYGWLIWNQFPPSTTWLGAPAILAAGGIIAWREHRAGRIAMARTQAEARAEV
ncbi:MAG: DMT family transporter [Novosphingobium sp.]|nr:DMT family transporter [Novosphingobium sp.]